MIGKFEVQIRKRFHLFSKRQKSKHQDLEDLLLSCFSSEEFVFLGCDYIMAFLAEAKEVQLRRFSSSRRKLERSLELEGEGLSKLLELPLHKVFSGRDPLLLMVPLTWKLSGGFLIHASKLFPKFDKVSSFVDEDFDLYLDNFYDQVAFRGERSGNRLSFIEMTNVGNGFDRLISYVKGI